MALQEKIYWESLAWKSSSHLPLQCNKQEPSSEKQKANKASIRKALKKAGPHRCFSPSIDKENVAAASYNLGFSSVPFCACKSSAQIKGNHFDTPTGRRSVDSIVGGARRSVDVISALARTQTGADSLEGTRRSIDSAITAEFPEKLLARVEAHLDRRAREAGLSIKPSKEKPGLDGECKNEQRVKEANVHALDDNGCKNVNLFIKSPNDCAQERIRGSKDGKCKNGAWKGATNVYVHDQRLCKSIDELVCKTNGQGVNGSNMHAHQRICRSIDSGLYVKIRSSDMPMSMQLYVVRLTKHVLVDKQQEHLSLMDTARALKKGLDSQYGFAWHCVVGSSYGSYVTHSVGSAIYFYVGNLAILLFKTNLSLHSSSP